VVIGGTSGIGHAVAKAVQEDGATTVLGSSSAANVEAARARLPGAEGHVLDVKDEASVAAFFARVGAFDHLVYTAGDWGRMRGGPIDMLDLAAAAGAFTVRFWGALAAIKHGRKHMREGGSIVLTDGTIAHRPHKGTAISTAMTGAIEHLVRGLAVDLAPLRVNGVCPGMIRTEAWDDIPADKAEERFAKMTARHPLPRIGEPWEAAEAYLYLLRGSFTTGQVLRVDGGQTVV
jgi:NAD(P)-dependent dehydrogenase (short-subunit alcohol dehydrogenase family)